MGKMPSEPVNISLGSSHKSHPTFLLFLSQHPSHPNYTTVRTSLVPKNNNNPSCSHTTGREIRQLSEQEPQIFASVIIPKTLCPLPAVMGRNPGKPKGHGTWRVYATFRHEAFSIKTWHLNNKHSFATLKAMWR